MSEVLRLGHISIYCRVNYSVDGQRVLDNWTKLSDAEKEKVPPGAFLRLTGQSKDPSYKESSASSAVSTTKVVSHSQMIHQPAQVFEQNTSSQGSQQPSTPSTVLKRLSEN